ncbi:M1 family metallopeptidase [Actinomadura atramentaria]|uniref:M1 family metallopeptidase n=1 Tax=Actinomadura atramentaria TaxID=1990 RepID=UPI000527980A|nr:M1 family metallopeptidase [Actinomadura atramentaria]
MHSALAAAVAAALLPLSLAPSGASPGLPGFTPGAPGAGDPYFPKAGNGGFDVAAYDIALTYTPKGRRIAATTRVTATATQNLSRFDLDFTGNTVRSVTVDGAKAAFRRDGGELVVTPARGLPKGRRFTVAVAYTGAPATDKDPELGKTGWIPTKDGAVTLSEPTGSSTWFPVSDHPSDKARFSYAITVPKGLRVVANGEPVGTAERRAATTYRWRTAQPMAPYLALVAIGKFDVRDGRSPGGVRTITAADPALRVKAADFQRDTAAVTDWETKLFGRFPFDSTGGVVDNVGVGYALETQNRPVYPNPANDILLVHELAHQWFGDSVSVARWKDIWLNEGFATYAEWLWREKHGKQTSDDRFAKLYAKPASSPAWKIKTGEPGKAGMFDEFAIYDRGAMTLHALRRKVGDAVFFRILREWPARFAHRNATSEDFIAFAERVSGTDLDGLFDAWLFTAAKPPKP